MRDQEFENFIQAVRSRLGEPLPGREAQIKMAPKPVDERRFTENPSRPAKLGGVMVLLYPHESGIHIPLMKRPEYDGAHSGQISFPGGKLEQSDKDLVATALRETEEEIGVRSGDIEVLGNLSELFIIASNFKVLPTVGVLKNTPRFIPDPIEVAEVLPMPLKMLHDQSVRKVKEMHFPPYTIFSPYFELRGEVVWGATAMMLSELAHVLEEVESNLR
ncbi:NUDIX hydrolase [Roseivirga sp.]|uniref:NUDIX hydrolase n=1 Tax=Roseivirga sp. TaxID=1964215 RepID=UPI003B51C70A